MDAESVHTWSIRASSVPDGPARVYARTRSFAVGEQAGLHPNPAEPSALEHLLGSLAADLISWLRREAARAGLRLEEAEVSLTAALENPLAALGVIGESGSAAVSRVDGSVFVSSESSASELLELWSRVCARAPVYSTLSRCAAIRIVLKVTL